MNTVLVVGNVVNLDQVTRVYKITSPDYYGRSKGDVVIKMVDQDEVVIPAGARADLFWDWYVSKAYVIAGGE